MKTLRSTDTLAEQEVAKFLDLYLYEKLKKVFPAFTYQREKNKAEQISGIDVEVQTTKTAINVDEKAAIYYANTPLSTFAFELLYTNQANIQNIGWFLNNNLKTNEYLLMWLTLDEAFLKKSSLVKSRFQAAKLTFKEIESIECCTISKAKLLKELEKRFSSSALLDMAKQINNNSNLLQSINNKNFPSREYFLQYSQKLAEKPVNLLITKPFLFRLAKSVFTVTPNNITYLKRNKEADKK